MWAWWAFVGWLGIFPGGFLEGNPAPTVLDPGGRVMGRVMCWRLLLFLVLECLVECKIEKTLKLAVEYDVEWWMMVELDLVAE